MQRQKKIRFGVLGVSKIAKRSAIAAIVQCASAELCILGGRMPERNLSLAEELGCAVGTYEEVLESDVDAVYISLPNALHAEWSVRALKAGKHVWCEKPTALNYAEAKNIVAAAKSAKRRVMEGFMFLYHPQHAKVLEMLHDGKIGEVLGFEGRFAFPTPEDDSNLLNMELGGGAYNDAIVYPLRASRMIFNEKPSQVTCSIVSNRQSGLETEAAATLMYSGERTALLSSAFTPEYRSTYVVRGKRGTITVERAYAISKDLGAKIFLEIAGEREEIRIEPADQFLRMVDAFCEELLLGSESTKDFERDLLEQAEILDAGRRSSEQGQTIEL